VAGFHDVGNVTFGIHLQAKNDNNVRQNSFNILKLPEGRAKYFIGVESEKKYIFDIFISKLSKKLLNLQPKLA
jgi:hypothetical protein